MTVTQERPVDEQAPVPARLAASGREPRAERNPHEEHRRHGRRPGRWGFVRDVVDCSDRDRVLGLAAETAFFAVLGFFPALLIAAGILGQLDAVIGEDVAARVQQETVDALGLVLTEQAGGVVDSVDALFESTRGDLLTVASVLAFIALSTAFATVVNALNHAYDVPESRGWWRRRVLGLFMGFGTVLAGTLVLVVVVVGPLFVTENLASQLRVDADGALWRFARPLVALLALWLWATALCHFSPARRTAFRYDLLGALLTAGLWLLASAGFHAYLLVIADRNPLLGALGGGLILLTWVYLLALGLLIGAEVNAELQARWGVEPLPPGRARQRSQQVLAMLPALPVLPTLPPRRR